MNTHLASKLFTPITMDRLHCATVLFVRQLLKVCVRETPLLRCCLIIIVPLLPEV